jgi:hypothetical protein
MVMKVVAQLLNKRSNGNESSHSASRNELGRISRRAKLESLIVLASRNVGLYTYTNHT